MKTIIAGGRAYKFTQEDVDFLESLKHEITEVVSGGAKGADLYGELWARRCSIPVIQIPAQWGLYGNRAGPLRNEEMGEYADALIVFSGGRGTRNMYDIAVKKKLKIYDQRK